MLHLSNNVMIKRSTRLYHLLLLLLLLLLLFPVKPKSQFLLYCLSLSLSHSLTLSLSFSSSSSAQCLSPFSSPCDQSRFTRSDMTQNFIQAGSPLRLLLLLPLFSSCPFTQPSNGERHKHEHTLCSIQIVVFSAFSSSSPSL